MGDCTTIGLTAAAGLAFLCGVGLAGEPQSNSVLGVDDFHPSPEHPVGWLGDLSGRYPGARDFPLEWDTRTGQNILWKTELPGWGFSSPIVVGKKVFVTCDPYTTVCIDADTGAILWKKDGDGVLTYPVKGKIYFFCCGYAMGTACSDGKNVFVVFYNGLVMSYDLDGNLRWKKVVPTIAWSGSSPVLMDGKFIVRQGGSPGPDKRNGPAEVVAYSCEDGSVVWRTDKFGVGPWNCPGYTPLWVDGVPYIVCYNGVVINARDGTLVAQMFEPYRTAIWVPSVQGDTVVLTRAVDKDPRNWREGLKDLGKIALSEPVGMAESLRREETITQRTYVGTSTYKGIPRGKRKGGWCPRLDWLVVPLKVASDGKGGLRFEALYRPVLLLGNGEFPHMVLNDDFLYFVGDGNHAPGTITVIDLKTGQALNPGGYDGWNIQGKAAPEYGPCGGSPFFYPHSITAGDYLMVGDWPGRITVLNRAPTLGMIAINQTTWFKKPAGGNPIGAPSGGYQSSQFHQGNRIYLRNWDAVYCIGDPKAAENAAAFAAAKAHADGGRVPQALQAYHQLWNAEALHVRYRAVREMGAVLGAQAIDEFSQAFRHSDTNLRVLAVSVVAKIPGDAVARKLGEGLGDSDPSYRCLVLEALGQRGDRAASPQVATAMDDKAAEVRMAAIGAAKRIGGAAAVQAVVARVERFSEPERTAAAEALIAMPEPETEKGLAEQVPQAAPRARSILLRVLGSRGVTAQTALVLGDAGHADRSVRLAALESLAMIAGAQELDPVVARMKQAKDDDERRAIEGVLLSIFGRTRAADVYAASVLRGLPPVEGSGFASLIRVLGPAGGKESLTKVRAALAGKDAAIRSAAVEAAAAWPDAAPESDLMAVAKTDRNSTNLAVAVGGLLRMLDFTPKRPSAEIFAIYAQAVKTGQALGATVTHMAAQKDIRTIEMAAGLLERKEIEEAIVETLVTAAPGAAEQDAPKTIAVLTKAVDEVKDRIQRERLDATVKELLAKYGSSAIEIPVGEGLGL